MENPYYIDLVRKMCIRDSANAVNSSLSVALPVNINNETLVSIAYSIMSYLLPTIAISPSLKRLDVYKRQICNR